MKNQMLKIGLGLSVIGLGTVANIGCAQKSNSSSSTLYSTSFAMSASSAPSTVALQTPLQKLMNALLPTVNAGIPSNLIDSQGSTINLSSAWVVVKEVKFKSAESSTEESEDESNEEIKFRGPYFVNLLSAQAQVLDTQQLPAKVYRRIEMKLEAVENHTSASWPADAPLGLENNSIYLAGTFGSGNTSFTFSSHDGSEFKVSGPNGITPEEGQNILMSFRFADIVRQIDFSALALAASTDISESNRVIATNPCPLIESSANDLYTCFRKGLEAKSDFGKDSDHSGEIESDEEDAK